MVGAVGGGDLGLLEVEGGSGWATEEVEGVFLVCVEEF